MGTWQMPPKIPPARVILTSRTTAGAASLTEWIKKNPDLLQASNGLRPEILGKVSILPNMKPYHLHFFSTSKNVYCYATIVPAGGTANHSISLYLV